MAAGAERLAAWRHLLSWGWHAWWAADRASWHGQQHAGWHERCCSWGLSPGGCPLALNLLVCRPLACDACSGVVATFAKPAGAALLCPLTDGSEVGDRPLLSPPRSPCRRLCSARRAGKPKGAERLCCVGRP